MIVYLGQDVVVSDREIISIMDFDAARTTKITRNFLEAAKEQGKYISLGEASKSIVVTKKKGEPEIVYASPISCTTLIRRCRKLNCEQF